LLPPCPPRRSRQAGKRSSSSSRPCGASTLIKPNRARTTARTGQGLQRQRGPLRIADRPDRVGPAPMNEHAGTAPFLPNSASARDLAYVLHPMTNLVQHAAEGPLVVSRGEGIYIVDDQGRHYVEGVSGLWSVTLGFHNERLAQAAYRQLLELPSYHMFRFKSHGPAIELAERL